MLPQRDYQKIFLYQVLTFGLYFFYWCARAGREVNQLAGRQLVSSPWFLILPFGNYWWAWTYADGLETVSRGQIKRNDIFLFYIVAKNLWWLVLPSLQFFPSDYYNHWVVWLPIIIFGFVAGCLSFGLFCSATQKKLNRFLGQPPQTLPKQG